MTNRDEVGAAAVDYRACWGIWCMATSGHAWPALHWQNRPARRRRSTPPNSPRHAFYYSRLMTETACSRRRSSRGENLMEIEEDWFALGY